MPKLFQVTEVEINAVLGLSFPQHPETTFDEEALKQLVARSFSLTLDEKREVIWKADRFTQHQVAELFRILKEEQEKFAELNAKHEARQRALQDS